MKRLAVLAVSALTTVAVLPAFSGSAAAADEPTGSGGRSIVITDPAGDVVNADDTTPAKARKGDVSRATYEVRRDRTFRGVKKKTRSVHFELEYGGTNRTSGFGCGERLVITFTSGDLQYRASYGRSLNLESRTEGGAYEPAQVGSYGGGCGGSATEGSAEIDIPANNFRSGVISDIRASLHVAGSRARDVVPASSDYLRFKPGRPLSDLRH